VDGDERLLYQIGGLRGIVGESPAKKSRELALQSLEQRTICIRVASEAREHQCFQIGVRRSHPASVAFV
jgi:hypothetical protein